MGTAIFNPAIRGTVQSSGHPMVLLALIEGQALIADVDGKLGLTNPANLQIDWRYDFQTERWNTADGEPLEPDEE